MVAGPVVPLETDARYVAFLASGKIATTTVIVPIRTGFWPVVNRRVLPVLFCFLFNTSRSPGPLSLDQRQG